MSGLDVEALLDSAANGSAKLASPTDNHDNRRREVNREGSWDRDRDRKHRDKSKDRHRRGAESDRNGDFNSPRSEHGSTHGSHRSRRRSRSRDDQRTDTRNRSRSRSPDRDRFYRPPGRDRRHRDSERGHRDSDRDRYRDRERDKDDHRSGRGRDARRHSPTSRGVKSKSPTPQPTEDERDRRTVFVQQLAARLRTKELIGFFEKVGPVKEAQIVKDRVSGRSKGVGYVEFKQEESVQAAIQLTGQKLLGIPIIAQLTEAEKNRQARNPDGAPSGSSSVPFHRLYVGNIHFSITERDLQNVFEPFGELEFVQLQKEEQGRSRGYGFVQFRDPVQAREALEKMNGFELAGRPIRVGLGNDKFTPESTANLLQRFQGQNQQSFQGSAFSGHGGRGAHAGGSGGNFDRAGGRDNDKGTGGASALDDTDVAGVNFSNYSRDALMRKLARTDDPAEAASDEKNRMAKAKPEVASTPLIASQASRCIILRNMFDPSKEEGDSWVKELEDDVRAECEEKYGHVVHIALDPNTQGDIYLKFDRVQGGENAIKGLNGRFFGGHQISAQPVVDAVYSSLFSRSKAL